MSATGFLTTRLFVGDATLDDGELSMAFLLLGACASACGLLGVSNVAVLAARGFFLGGISACVRVGKRGVDSEGCEKGV